MATKKKPSKKAAKKKVYYSGRKEKDRVAAGEVLGDPQSFSPSQSEGCFVKHVDVKTATREYDPKPVPSPREFVEQGRGLASNLSELPIAEREALVPPPLRLDVPVNRTIEVLGIQVKRELLTAE